MSAPIQELGPDRLPAIRALLGASALPVEDLDPALLPRFFGVEGADGLQGVVALERQGEAGLLRSLAVAPASRGTGLGRELVQHVEAQAVGAGLRELWLLTTTAEPFFRHLGWEPAARDRAPEGIRGTSEFRSVCPSSAACLRRDLRGLMQPYRVLVLCTGNSARSQIAEALLAERGAGRFVVASAGSRPAARVNPYAVRVLAERGIAWEGRVPKPIEGLEGERWDFVITVCDRAREACPIFPRRPVFAHWGMPDPAEVGGTDEEKLRAFRDTLITLERRIALFLELPLEKLDRLAREQAVRALAGR
ncbi:MAG: GNAT family N-acetyltransferase [Gemmatimonadetes bacterium]|nr:GNAT family N-acetyltransferase [Gemmatimonadota bacterium]